MSDWGQGAVNNSIDWGDGASDNLIYWGDVHYDSYGHPLTNLTGLIEAVELFFLRVITDGGEVIASNCANTAYHRIQEPIIDVFSDTFDDTFN